MDTKPRILIADENIERLHATCQLLEAHGYVTSAAENGRDALILASADLPDLVLVNSSLPDIDGFEICRRIEGLPGLGDVFTVIVLEERLGDENRFKSPAQGVDGYLVRPISDEALLLRLQTLLSQREAEVAIRLNEARLRQLLDESLQEKNKFLQALHETTLELISEHDLHTLLENIVKRAGQLVGTDSGFLDLVEPDAQRLKPQVGLGALAGSLALESKSGDGLAGLVWQSGQPLVIDDYDSWGERMHDFSPGKITSAAGVPLLSGGRVLGVLGLAYVPPSKRKFGPEALEFLTQFARLAAIAIENARLFSALQQELAEHNRAELALRSSEERFRLAFRTSPDAININRMNDGLYVDINEGFTHMTGYTREEVIGKSSLELNIWHDPVDRARLVAGLRQAGVVSNLEAQFQMKNGQLITGLMSARIIMLDEIPHILSITRDIDEKKRTEEALRESEQKFRRVVEASPTAMHFYHLENQNRLVLIDSNPAADRMLGISHQALVGSSIEAAFPNLANTRITELYKKVASGELGPQAFETRYKDERLDGYFDVHVYQTSPGFILVNFIDISERKRTEQALREREFWLRESQRVGRIGSYILDIPNNRWESSDVMDEIFGIPPSYEKSLQSWSGLVHPDERQMMLDYFNNHVVGEKQAFNKEYRIVRVENGEERWVWGRGELDFDENDAPVRMIGTIQDVTERKQADEQIKRLNTQLEQRVAERTAQLQVANKELEAFAYSVSHDLRAPLRGIAGWSQALLEDYGFKLDEQGRKYLDRVRNETSYMGQLIDDLLQLSRFTRSEMEFGPVDLSALAQAIVKRLQETLGDRKVEFVIQPGLVAQGDSHLLEIALINLFNNAIKFTQPRALAKVEFGQTLQNGKPAYFIRDNGVGFDMIYAKNLFGAFQRMHKQSEFPGSGIGLATVQRIIHRHGGRIWADSKPDEGAVFYFSLDASA